MRSEADRIATTVVFVRESGRSERRQVHPRSPFRRLFRRVTDSRFINSDGPGAGTNAAAGTNMNGIANNGTIVGFGIANNGNLTNFTANPLTSTNANVLTSLATNAMALGVNSAGSVVGGDGNNQAFIISGGGSPVSFLPGTSTTATAFGINDNGVIVGQMTVGGVTPGFVLNGDNLITVNAPNGTTTNAVNAQGINNNGLVVGFYLGNDDHRVLLRRQWSLSRFHRDRGTGTWFVRSGVYRGRVSPDRAPASAPAQGRILIVSGCKHRSGKWECRP